MIRRAIWSFIRPLYWHTRRLAETRLLGTLFNEFVWRYRHIILKPKLAQEYLESTSHHHREPLIESLASYAPQSVLEVGCATGPNLALLAARLPTATLYGLDINRNAVRIGQEYFDRAVPGRVRLTTGQADDLALFENDSMDLVFTDAVLVLVGPDKIFAVLRELGRVARRLIVLNEYHSDCPPARNYHDGRYVYDYARLVATELPGAAVSFAPSPFTGGLWDKYGRLITIELESGQAVAHE